MTAICWRITLFGSLCLLKETPSGISSETPLGTSSKTLSEISSETLSGAPLETSAEDQAVCVFPPSIVGCLLAYLVCHPNRTHSRQELAERFWPEADSAVGRTRLRQHLTALKRQLEEAGVPSGGILNMRREDVVVTASAFTTDVAEFEEALRRAAQTQNPADRAGPLERALALYRGPLLAGYYDHWVLAERERLKEGVVAALRQRAGDCENNGETTRALAYLQRLVAVDPLREASHLHLMRLLIADNQTAAARRQLKTLERLFKAELDAVPSPEACALIAGLPVRALPALPLGSVVPTSDSSPPAPDAYCDAQPNADALPADVQEPESIMPADEAQPELLLSPALEILPPTAPEPSSCISTCTAFLISPADLPSLSTPPADALRDPAPRSHRRPRSKARQAEMPDGNRTAPQSEAASALSRARHFLALAAFSLLSLLAVGLWGQWPLPTLAFNPAGSENGDALPIRGYKPRPGGGASKLTAGAIATAGANIAPVTANLDFPVILCYRPSQWAVNGADRVYAFVFGANDRGDTYARKISLGQFKRGTDMAMPAHIFKQTIHQNEKWVLYVTFVVANAPSGGPADAVFQTGKTALIAAAKNPAFKDAQEKARAALADIYMYPSYIGSEVYIFAHPGHDLQTISGHDRYTFNGPSDTFLVTGQNATYNVTIHQ